MAFEVEEDVALVRFGQRGEPGQHRPDRVPSRPGIVLGRAAALWLERRRAVRRLARLNLQARLAHGSSEPVRVEPLHSILE